MVIFPLSPFTKQTYYVYNQVLTITKTYLFRMIENTKEILFTDDSWWCGVFKKMNIPFKYEKEDLNADIEWALKE